MGLTVLEGSGAGSLPVRFGASSEEALPGTWPVTELPPSAAGASRVFREVHKVPVHPDSRMFSPANRLSQVRAAGFGLQSE